MSNAPTKLLNEAIKKAPPMRFYSRRGGLFEYQKIQSTVYLFELYLSAVPKLRVEAAFFEKLGVSSALDDLTCLHNEYQVGVEYR